MKQLIQTTHLEYNKSSFLIDLVEHDSGLLYVEIHQTIFANEKSKNHIKINPASIGEIIETLQKYEKLLPAAQQKNRTLSIQQKHQKIQDRYLRGLPINDLAVQFDETEEAIIKILTDQGIKMVNLKPPRNKWWKRKKR